MLFKHSTQRARNAVFAARGAGDAAVVELVAASPPSDDEIAVAGLREANEALRREMATLRAEWQDALATAEERARDAAALKHVRDDEKRHALLVAALEGARQVFERDLLAIAGKSARELAAGAVEKFVALHRCDGDWLARIIEQRLASLDRSAVMSVQISPSDLEGAVAAVLPQGTALEADAALPPGTARVRLRLGTIEVDSDAGLTRLLGLLRDGQVDD